MEKKTFQQLKDEFTSKAKIAGACCGEYKRALNSNNDEDLLAVIYDNLTWCSSHSIISNEYFSHFPIELVIKSGIANSGKENTGFSNSGDSNSGDWNSGNRNSGYSNSGYSNSGNWNSGYSNSGYSNSGNWNSGYSNSGNSNSGDWNSGNRNSGNWNSGDWNSGDSNSGYRNSGAFCTEINPKLWLFDNPTDINIKDWENGRAVELMYSIYTTIWVNSGIMNDEEKAANPHWETTEGYLKTIPIKEAWANAWHNWSEENRSVFKELPNFDADKFKEITGIDVNA